MAHLVRLQESRPPESFKRVRHLREGVFECRPQGHRILLCFGPWRGSIVLLRAFPKQSEDAPESEIKEAIKLKGEAESICRAGGTPWPEIIS